MRLAMSVGTRRHYKIEEIQGRHFVQTGRAANLPNALIQDAIQEMVDNAEQALEQIEDALPPDFPEAIHEAVKQAVKRRVARLSVTP